MKKILIIQLIIIFQINLSNDPSSQLIQQTTSNIKTLFSSLVVSEKPNRFQQIRLKNQQLAWTTAALHNLCIKLNSLKGSLESRNRILKRPIEPSDKKPIVSVSKNDLEIKYFNTIEHTQQNWLYTEFKSWPDDFLNTEYTPDDYIVFEKESNFNLIDIIDALFSFLDKEIFYLSTEKYYIEEERTTKKTFIILKRSQLFEISNKIGFPIPNECLQSYKRMIKPWRRR